MRLIKVIALVCCVMSLGAFLSNRMTTDESETEILPSSIYDFKITSLDGRVIDFADFKGRSLLIVNTASKCGYTPQYADLEKIHEAYGSKVAVLGFPANNFLWQEPGSNKDIADFCQVNYGVNFQMFEKISVKGTDKHPLYRWLEEKTGKSPTWNFCKYVVSRDGTEVKFFPSKINPLDHEITLALER
ncbi:MAG TPA: glutathione peroxidase [Chryseolinea sp.]|nr:glutathione peroxidase [Chryseolinea sp.]